MSPFSRWRPFLVFGMSGWAPMVRLAQDCPVERKLILFGPRGHSRGHCPLRHLRHLVGLLGLGISFLCLDLVSAG